MVAAELGLGVVDRGIGVQTSDSEGALGRHWIGVRGDGRVLRRSSRDDARRDLRDFGGDGREIHARTGFGASFEGGRRRNVELVFRYER